VSQSGFHVFIFHTGVTELNRISLNIPNLLTIFRLALVPVVIILIYYGMTIAALIMYLIACATDLLDGFIARRFNMITEEGILLDPLADKLMSVGAIIAFTVIRNADGTHVVPVAILIIILVKEALMIGGGVFLYYKNIVTPSNIFGKTAAFVLNTAVAFTFLYEIVSPWHVYFLWFALVLMVAALAQYAYFNMYKKFKARGKANN
jgi:cardiolipin synthase